jgi:hypothetical protein
MYASEGCGQCVMRRGCTRHLLLPQMSYLALTMWLNLRHITSVADASPFNSAANLTPLPPSLHLRTPPPTPALLRPDFPADVAAGIVVTRVAPGSPAAAAGLREDDVIVAAAAPGAAPGQLGPTGLSVAALADALRDAIGGSLDLVVVREQQQQQQQGAAAGAAGAVTQGGSGSSRYAYVTVTVKPVEAPSG